jgi:hypothetical protein
MENPVIRIRPLDPNAGPVAGDDLCGAQNDLGLFGLDLEPRMGAHEHVHQRAFPHAQTESVTEQTAQPLVG